MQLACIRCLARSVPHRRRGASVCSGSRRLPLQRRAKRPSPSQRAWLCAGDHHRCVTAMSALAACCGTRRHVKAAAAPAGQQADAASRGTTSQRRGENSQRQRPEPRCSAAADTLVRDPAQQAERGSMQVPLCCDGPAARLLHPGGAASVRLPAAPDVTQGRPMRMMSRPHKAQHVCAPPAPRCCHAPAQREQRQAANPPPRVSFVPRGRRRRRRCAGCCGPRMALDSIFIIRRPLHQRGLHSARAACSAVRLTRPLHSAACCHRRCICGSLGTRRVAPRRRRSFPRSSVR